MRGLLILALLGCKQYARTTTVNAPGDVELATPLPNENGDPARFEGARDPGTRSTIVVVSPTVLGGSGRDDDGALELGMELRFERTDSSKRWTDPALAVIAGAGFAQFGDQRDPRFGALHAELGYRFIAKFLPMDIGVGAAFYPADPGWGGQLSVRVPLLTVRLRYMEQTGFEVWGGYELPIPLIFSRSK